MHIVVRTFRLAEGVAEADFLAADAHHQTAFAYQQPGLVRRTTARGADGEWLIVSLFRSREDADATARAATDDAVAQVLAACVDPASVDVRHFDTLD